MLTWLSGCEARLDAMLQDSDGENYEEIIGTLHIVYNNRGEYENS